MDRLSLNTRLPPRKRLLAGLRNESSDSQFPPPNPPILPSLDARFPELFISETASPVEIIEASRTAAMAAAEVAAKARASAMEKACAAAKARAAAKSALEFLESVTRDEARREGRAIRSKSKKKHVPVKLLYKNNQPVETHETDEELARKLHHAMNSSSRISRNSQKKRRSFGDMEASGESVVSNDKSPDFCDGDAQLMNECSNGKVEEDVRVCAKDDIFEKEGGCSYTEMSHVGSRNKGTSGGKQAKVKRKKLPLSQCNTRDRGKLRDMALTRAPKSNYAERSMSLNDEQGEVPMKITSLWKCKKFKVSRRSSESKIPRNLHSNSSAKTSSMVKVD